MSVLRLGLDDSWVSIEGRGSGYNDFYRSTSTTSPRTSLAAGLVGDEESRFRICLSRQRSNTETLDAGPNI